MLAYTLPHTHTITTTQYQYFSSHMHTAKLLANMKQLSDVSNLEDTVSCPSMSACVLGTISLITMSFSVVSTPPTTLSSSCPLPLATSTSNPSYVVATVITSHVKLPQFSYEAISNHVIVQQGITNCCQVSYIPPKIL